MPVASSISWKPLRDSHYIVASLQPGGGALRQVFVRQSTLREIQAIAHRDPDQPVVGLLIGERFDCALSTTPYFLIESHVEVAIASLDERTVSNAIQTLYGRLGRLRSAEVLGWFCTSRATEPAVSRTTAAVHGTWFTNPWQTALIFGDGGGTAAFYLHDARAARWFQAPFYEITDAKATSRAPKAAPKATCVQWPSYLTMAQVIPLAEAPQAVVPAPAQPVVAGPPSPSARPEATASRRPIVTTRRTPAREAIDGLGRVAVAARRSAVDLANLLRGHAATATRQGTERLVGIRADWEARAAQRKAEADAARAREEQTRAKEAAERQAAREEAERRAAEAAKRRAAEAEARRVAEAEARRKAAEEAERRRVAEAEAQRKAAEEAERRRAAEAEARRQAAEAEARRRAEEAEAKRIAEAEAAEAKRVAEAEAAEARRIAEAEAAEARRVAEAEAQRKAKEEAQRRAAEAEARRKAAEEAQRIAAEEERRRAVEAEARRQAEEAEAATRRQAAEAEARRQAEEAEARRLAEAEEQARREAAEAEARRLAEADAQRVAREAEARRQAAEAEAAARRQAAEAEARRRAAEVEAETRRRAAEAEARRLAEAEEKARHEAAAAEARRVAEAEAQRVARETEARRLAEQAAAEERRRAAEAKAEADRRAEEAEAERRAAKAEAERRVAEAEAEAQRKAAEAEEDARRKAAEAEEDARRKAAETEEDARRRAEEAEVLRISVEVAATRARLARPPAPIEGSKRETPRSAPVQAADTEDTRASDGPYRYLALARREGFEVSQKIEHGTPEHPETVWLLHESESGLRLIVVTTDAEVREASLHYNLRTEDDSVLRVTAPEHRDLASRTIYGREPCLHDLRARCRRLRATGMLERDWKVSPSFQTPVSRRPVLAR